MFVTGLAGIPPGGFLRKIAVKETNGEYIRAHTCFNSVEIPRFVCYEAMKEALEMVLIVDGRMED